MKKIFIEGMSCQHCVGAVNEALNSLEGAKDIVVSLEEKCATLNYDGEEAKLKDAIEDIGFEVVGIE